LADTAEAFLHMIQALQDISPVTRALSDYVAEALGRPLPEDVAEKARHHILDTLAAMVSGTHLYPGKMALTYIATLGGTKESSVIGSRISTSAVNAALAGGMLAHADETDDSHAPSRNHPGCAVVPAALAVGETAHASGEMFLRAVVLGYDIAARLNYALDADAFAAASRSTHSVGGTFGAGAAAGALLGFNAEQARHLFSYCAQQASGVACNVRDSEHVEKAFDFGGMPARNGVTAATMVAAGFTGVDDVFSGERNFFEAYAPNPNPALLAEELGTRFEILKTNIKKWSVGSPAQSALDALTYLMETEKLTVEQVADIDVHLPTRSARTVDNAPMPDVNVQHLLAMLLVDGTLSFDSIHDHGRMEDPNILVVRQRIRLIPSEELMHARPRRQAIVEVVTNDGRRLARRTLAVRGTADNPMNRKEVEAKAGDLIAAVLGVRRANKIIRAVRDLSSLTDVGQFAHLCRPQENAR
jgi:2-methylcitrate dehydratase PrpD